MEVGTVGRPWGEYRRENLVVMDGRGELLDDSGGAGELSERCGEDERAMLRVRAAAAGRVEVGGVRRLGLAARVEDQRVHIGQPEPARDERHDEHQGIEPAKQAASHAAVYGDQPGLSTVPESINARGGRAGLPQTVGTA